MKIDLNGIIKVRLTEEGKKVALSFFSQVTFSLAEAKIELAKRWNADGTYCFDFTDFMRTFGGFNALEVIECFDSVEIISGKKNNHIRLLK